MQTFLNRRQQPACLASQVPVHELTDEQLLTRQVKNRQTLMVVVGFMLLVIGLSVASDQLLIAAATGGMIPALDSYEKMRKDITKELRKRNLR